MERLTFSRRPGWFAGGEEGVESYVMTVLQVQQLEVALRKARPETNAHYRTLLRLHRQMLALAVSLTVRLRLTSSTKLDRRTPQDGELPVA
jgi:hypothetical protein